MGMPSIDSFNINIVDDISHISQNSYSPSRTSYPKKHRPTLLKNPLSSRLSQASGIKDTCRPTPMGVIGSSVPIPVAKKASGHGMAMACGNDVTTWLDRYDMAMIWLWYGYDIASIWFIFTLGIVKSMVMGTCRAREIMPPSWAKLQYVQPGINGGIPYNGGIKWNMGYHHHWVYHTTWVYFASVFCY